MTAPQLAQYGQGAGAVSGDNLNTFEQTCDNFAQLRALVGTTGMQIYTRGSANPADGGQGVFYWNSSSTAADDGYSVLAPLAAGAAGRWVRIPSGGAQVCTVATLPSFAQTGFRAMVSNANATTFYSIVASGGTSVVPVFYDGTNWRIG